MQQTKTTIDISKRTKGEWKVNVISEDETSIIPFYISTENEEHVICSVRANIYDNKLLINEAKANADFIVTACNNYDAMLAYIKEMAKRYENSEWIAGQANKIIQSIEENI